MRKLIVLGAMLFAGLGLAGCHTTSAVTLCNEAKWNNEVVWSATTLYDYARSEYMAQCVFVIPGNDYYARCMFIYINNHERNDTDCQGI